MKCSNTVLFETFLNDYSQILNKQNTVSMSPPKEQTKKNNKRVTHYVQSGGSFFRLQH